MASFRFSHSTLQNVGLVLGMLLPLFLVISLSASALAETNGSSQCGGALELHSANDVIFVRLKQNGSEEAARTWAPLYGGRKDSSIQELLEERDETLRTVCPAFGKRFRERPSEIWLATEAIRVASKIKLPFDSFSSVPVRVDFNGMNCLTPMVPDGTGDRSLFDQSRAWVAQFFALRSLFVFKRITCLEQDGSVWSFPHS